MKPFELDSYLATLEMNESILQAQVDFMKTVANLHRLKIIMILGQIDGEMEQRDLQKILGISKANLSQHLALLRSVGVVQSRPAGRITMISLKYPAIREACAMVKDVIARRASELVPAEAR